MSSFNRGTGSAGSHSGVETLALAVLRNTGNVRKAAAASVLLAIAVVVMVWWQASDGAPTAVAQANNPATGTVTVTNDGHVEVHNTLTATVDATDADGLVDVAYTYKWFYEKKPDVDPDVPRPICSDGRRVQPRVGTRGETLLLLHYDVAKGGLCVVVEFQDDLGNDEFLESSLTTEVPTGAIIDVAYTDTMGVERYDRAVRPAAGSKLKANTIGVNYPDMADQPDFTYQWIHWKLGGRGLTGKEADISGATSDTYTVVAADAGKIIQLELTFKVTPSGTRTTFANFATEYIQILPPSVALTSSAVSGEPEVNFELTAEVTAVGITNPSISYGWYAVPPGQTLSTTAHRISGASGATYTPGQTDIGRLIAVIARFTDGIGNPHSPTRTTALPVRSSAVIVAPGGFYINETIQVNTATMNLRGLPASSTFTYQWLYVDGNGVIAGNAEGTSDAQSYALTAIDNGQYMQVRITFTDTVDSTERMVLANMQTPQISERPPAELAENLSAQVPSNGGSVRLTWGLASTGSELPAKFQYRYKSTGLLATTPFADTDWEDVSGGGSARGATITGALINVAEYTFELRSVGRLGFGTQEVSDTATYRHATRDC